MNAPDTYLVTTNHWYGGAAVYCTATYFRWYWQANAWSWFMHYVGGRNCNTYKRDTE